MVRPGITMLSCLVGVACAEQGELLPSPEPPPSLPGKVSCEDWADIEARSELELHRLGFFLASAIVDGELASPVEASQGYSAPFRIERVRFGWSFLEGEEIALHFDEEEIGTLEPGRYVVALEPGGWTSERRVRWLPVTLLPASETAGLEDDLRYRTSRTPFIAVVKLRSRDFRSTSFSVIEALRGELPNEFKHTSWPSNAALSPDQEYLASLSGLSTLERASQGTIVDLRPNTPENRRLVEAAIEAEVQPYTVEDLDAFFLQYHVSWRFFRAPHVVATTLQAVGHWCGGAIRSFLHHRIEHRFRGADDRVRITTEDESGRDVACGESFLMALRDLPDLEVKPEDPATCSQGCWAPGVDPVAARLPNDEARYAEVQRWLSAAPPAFRLHPPDRMLSRQDAAPAQPGYAPWSAPLDLPHGFVLSGRTRFEVVAVDDRGGWFEVTLELLDSPPRAQRVKLAFTCGDERLLREGSRWLGFVVADTSFPESPPAADSAFLAPGSLLPATRSSALLLSLLSRDLGALRRR